MRTLRIGLPAALALLWLLPFMLSGQAEPAQKMQIPAGARTLRSDQAPAPQTPQGKILHDALASDTRNTLQQAMDSADPGR